MSGGPSTLVLTFAELAYLLENTETVAFERLHLPRWDPDDPIAPCGASSLFARGLIREAGSELLVPWGQLVQLRDVLESPERWIEVGYASEDGAGATQLVEREAARYQVVARPVGTFLFANIPMDDPLETVVSRLVMNYLDGRLPRSVFVVTESRSGMDEGLALRCLEPDVFEAVIGRPQGSIVDVLDSSRAIQVVENFMTRGNTAGTGNLDK